MRGDVVLITGGSSGIGLAAAHRFARAGARLVLAARGREALDAAVAAVGGEARAVPTDITDPASIRALAADVAAREGRLDVLVNCAGQLEVGPVEAGGPELAERLIRVNYLGAVHAIAACLPLLRQRRRRSIVNVSSLAGRVAPPFMAAYAGSKFALAGYTHALRQELAPERFHIGIVSPGPVDTPMIQGRVRTEHYPLLPGVKVIGADEAAAAIERCVRRRSAEVVAPRYLGGVTRLGQAFPGLMDLAYRLAAR